jgi:hypothetical protein
MKYSPDACRKSRNVHGAALVMSIMSNKSISILFQETSAKKWNQLAFFLGGILNNSIISISNRENIDGIA